MKIIFMGTPDFSVGTLEALVRAGHEITLVVSQPDRPKGRGHELQPTAVKQAALRYGLPVWQPRRLRDEEAEQILRDTEADVMVVVAFGQLIPENILKLKKYGCINVHASLLPKYRGAAPIQWAVINGEKESGVTIMQMDAGLDTGDMLLVKKIPLEEKETGGSLFAKLSQLGAQACTEALAGLERGELTPKKQGESPTAYAKMLTKDMGELDFSRPAAELERLIRGLNPWPSAYTRLKGKTLKIWAAYVQEASEAAGKTPACGEVMGITDTAFRVACGQGTLVVTELQLEGKKRMDTGAFLRGFRLEAGTILGK